MKYLKIVLILVVCALSFVGCILDPDEDKVDWRKADSTGVTINSVDMFTDYHAYVVGSDGNIQYYNGSKWVEDSSPTNSSLRAVKVVSQSNVIAISSYYVYRFDGINWSQMEEPANSSNYYSLTALDDNHIWVGGNSGKIHFYDGASWSTISLDYSYIDCIYALDENNVFAAERGGKILHFNGIGWSEIGSFTGSASYTDICAFSVNDVWLSISSGQIFHFDGTDWEEKYYETVSVNSIDGLDSNNVWFACDDGVVLHWNGSNIKKQSTPTEQDLKGISMYNSKTGFAVGRNGIILKYNK